MAPPEPEQAVAAHVSYPMTATLPSFSGAGKEGENSFELWNFSVTSLIKDNVYPPHVVWQAIRKSLKGDAAEALMTFSQANPDLTVELLVGHMKSVFGKVASAATVVQSLYAAQQGVSESLTAWALRLQSLYRQTALSQPAMFTADQRESLLKARFWQGLRSSTLQEALRSEKDKVTVTFEMLLQQGREIDREFEVLPSHKKSSSKPLLEMQSAETSVVHGQMPATNYTKKKGKDKAQVTSQMSTVPKEHYDALLVRVQQLQQQLAKMGVASAAPSMKKDDRTCYFCKQVGHIARDCVFKRQAVPQVQVPMPTHMPTMPTYQTAPYPHSMMYPPMVSAAQQGRFPPPVLGNMWGPTGWTARWPRSQ